MPPKKKPDKKKKTKAEEEPTNYDVKIMSLVQLKQYARLLQHEIEDMRVHCSFYQKTDDKLFEFLMISEDNLGQNEGNIVSKDIEQERIKLKFLKDIREKRQWSKYLEHASFMTKEKLSHQTERSFEQEQERHLKETKRMKTILKEKDQQLEALRIKTETERKETRERNESSLEEMHNHQEGLLEKAIDRFDNAANETQDDFKQALEIVKNEAHEQKLRSETAFNDACEACIQKLQDYYKEVTRHDLDTIRKLNQEIKKEKESIISSKLQLQKVLEENNKLKEIARPSLAKRINQNIVKTYDVTPHKAMESLKEHNRTEKLVLENQNLEQQIKIVTKQTDNLRKQFTSALRKARDTAEMKAAFLERKLIYISDEKKSESEKGEKREWENDKDEGRESDRQTEREGDKETQINSEEQTEWRSEKETEKSKEKETEIESDEETEIESDGETEKESNETEK